jgi:hypothetical protein
MGLRLKVCIDCGRQTMIGKSKCRCKDCRRADPTKYATSPPPRTRRPAFGGPCQAAEN